MKPVEVYPDEISRSLSQLNLQKFILMKHVEVYPDETSRSLS